jgi:hypothetical protein
VQVAQKRRLALRIEKSGARSAVRGGVANGSCFCAIPGVGHVLACLGERKTPHLSLDFTAMRPG